DLRREAARVGQAIVTEAAPRSGAWRWEDRTGVLNAYYSAAEVAFVGGSLLPYGGHNPLEPAALGAAVVLGRHHGSQRDGVRALEEAGAAWVCGSEEDLGQSLATLLGDDAERARRAARGLAVVRDRRGAARRAVTRLGDWGLW